MNSCDIATFRGGDTSFEESLPSEIRDFRLHNIVEQGLLGTCPEAEMSVLTQEIADARSAMNLLLNALPNLTKHPDRFRTYRNGQIKPATEGFLYDWGNIRVCLHASHADTTGISHMHHTGHGNETAPVAALQIQTRAQLMMEVSHRVKEAHGGAYFFMIDNVWDAQEQRSKERTRSNMCSPYQRAQPSWIPVQEGDFYALGSKSYHNVVRQGIVPNRLNVKDQRCLSVFLMLIKEERARRDVTHDLALKKRNKLWDEIMSALAAKNLIEEQPTEVITPTLSSQAACL